MNRVFLFGLCWLLLLGTTGCRMCGSPYDYCGPIVGEGGGPCGGGGCSFVARRGSILDESGFSGGGCADCCEGSAGGGFVDDQGAIYEGEMIEEGPSLDAPSEDVPPSEGLPAPTPATRATPRSRTR